MVGRRVEERGPAGINKAGVGGKVDRSIVVESSDWTPAAVEILGVPRSDSRIRKSVVQDRIEASGGGDVLCQTIANYQVGQTVPSTAKTGQLLYCDLTPHQDLHWTALEPEPRRFCIILRAVH